MRPAPSLLAVALALGAAILLQPARAQATGGCGPSQGNRKCGTGYCCSKYGYCGTGSSYCGTGCLTQYSGAGSACGSGTAPAPAPAPAPATATRAPTGNLRTNAPTKAPSSSTAPAPTQGATRASCTMFGTYTTELLKGSVACQNELGKKANASSAVAAATFASTPTYNAQCGKCIKVTNLDTPSDPVLYITIIDQGGGVSSPGIDLNWGPAHKWPSLIEKGNAACAYQFVDAKLCTWTGL